MEVQLSTTYWELSEEELFHTAVYSSREQELELIESAVHLQNIVSVDCPVDSSPFVTLGKSPIAVAVPIPVQL